MIPRFKGNLPHNIIGVFALRRLDGRGHFQTEIISFRWRALYKDMEMFKIKI